MLQKFCNDGLPGSCRVHFDPSCKIFELERNQRVAGFAGFKMPGLANPSKTPIKQSVAVCRLVRPLYERVCERTHPLVRAYTREAQLRTGGTTKTIRAVRTIRNLFGKGVAIMAKLFRPRLVSIGGHLVGEDHPNARLKWDEVELMRQCHDAGLSMSAIARKFERPWSTVRDVCQYLTWTEFPVRPARHAPRGACHG